MSGGVEIIGLGHYVPERVVTSAELEAQLGLQRGWIRTRTGIRSRRYVSDDQALTDIAQIAGERALASAGIKPGRIALTLLATSTPDHLLPPSAPLLAHKLALENSGAIDLAGACAGFLYALALADGFVRTQRAPVMVVAANILSRRINPVDRGSAILFADAAGAVVLAPTPRDDAGVRSVDLRAQGSGYDLIHIPAGGSRRPYTTETALVDTKMVLSDGRAVFSKAVEMMVATSRTALAAAGIGAADVRYLLPHQANQRMIDMVASKLGIGPDRTLTTITDFGNSSAATMPLTLSMCALDHDFAKGDAILMTAAGAGLTGGSLVWGW
jgi:3-oxoacyl-[acyl-carrier-protein] synthase III